jgi:AraC family transcriptional regulator of adaptative response / DNA-3-methyladenine glycosylase II
MSVPSHAALHKAFLARDKRYDGRFYVGVRTTGIYCRPTCPARALLKNVQFYRSPAEAEEAGFRACLRCRPDLSPTAPLFHGTAAVVGRALRLIHEGVTTSKLAPRLGLTDRHVRRLFAEHVGASPVQVEVSQRLHLARQLLSQTARPVTEIAYGSGFRSLRRFNAAFLERYGRSPSEFRKSGAAPGSGITLEVPILEPYDWDSLFAFLSRHAVSSLEHCANGKYQRLLPHGGSITVARGRASLRVTIEGCEVSQVRDVLARVRNLFDVDHNPASLPRQARGVRIPGCWDGFETAAGIVVGQVVSAASAHAVLEKLMRKHGAPGNFPSPAKLARADLSGIGLTRAKARAVQGLALAVESGAVTLSRSAALAETRAALLAVPGIGPWTCELIALRCLGDPDAFPDGDLAVARALQTELANPEAWRPWRSYLTLLIWKQYSQLKKDKK